MQQWWHARASTDAPVTDEPVHHDPERHEVGLRTRSRWGEHRVNIEHKRALADVDEAVQRTRWHLDLDVVVTRHIPCLIADADRHRTVDHAEDLHQTAVDMWAQPADPRPAARRSRQPDPIPIRRLLRRGKDLDGLRRMRNVEHRSRRDHATASRSLTTVASFVCRVPAGTRRLGGVECLAFATGMTPP